MVAQHPFADETSEAQFDRLPPHSLEAEMCLVASLMLSGDDPLIYAGVGAVFDRDDFFQADNQVIYDALMDMRVRRIPIDSTTLVEHLRAGGVLDEVGGHDYLGRLLNMVPSAQHAVYYAKGVHSTAVRRRGIQACNAAIRALTESGFPEDVSASLSDLLRTVMGLNTTGKADRVHSIGKIAAEIVAANAAGERPQLAPTGLASLDALIGGLPIGGSTLIGASATVGKSTLLKAIAMNMTAGHPVGIISVEESRRKIGENVLANRAGVVNARIAHGTGTAEDWRAVATAAAKLKGCELHVVEDASGLGDILAMAEVLAVRHGCKMIGVDHLHIVDAQTGPHVNREQQMTKISGSLKAAWKRLGVAGVSCAQLNRPANERDRPTPRNLRDSGSLFQDGDVVLLLHREDVFRKLDGCPQDQFDKLLEVIVAKNKSGAAGHVVLKMDEARQQITDRDVVANPFGTPDEAAADYDSHFGGMN